MIGGYPYGTPVVGVTLVGRHLAGAYLEADHVDDDGAAWHAVVVADCGNLAHGQVLLRDVKVDVTHPLAAALLPEEQQARLAAVAIALLMEMDPSPGAEDMVVEHATPDEAVEQLRCLMEVPSGMIGDSETLHRVAQHCAVWAEAPDEILGALESSGFEQVADLIRLVLVGTSTCPACLDLGDTCTRCGGAGRKQQ